MRCLSALAVYGSLIWLFEVACPGPQSLTRVTVENAVEKTVAAQHAAWRRKSKDASLMS